MNKFSIVLSDFIYYKIIYIKKNILNCNVTILLYFINAGLVSIRDFRKRDQNLNSRQ